MEDAEKKNERKIFDRLPFEVVDIDEKILPYVFGMGEKWVQVGPKKYCMQDKYKQYGLEIYNFEARPDDVFLIGYPRSGTTLHCEAIWQIMNNLDYEAAEKDTLLCRFPHIDLGLFSSYSSIKNIAEIPDNVDDDVIDSVLKLYTSSLKDLADMKGRRLIKSHLPISLMPPHIFEVGAKIIYCARNPKNVITSFYNMARFLKHIDGRDFRNVFEAHRNNLAWNCPYFEHVKEAWARRNDNNFMFLFHEDTIKDKRQALKKIADFLGKKLSSDQFESLEDYLSIEKFKNNKSVNLDDFVKIGATNKDFQFIGMGKPGGWREYFVGDLENEVNKWMEENLKDTDLKFPEY